MIVALEFFIRSLNLRNNLPVPCSFCLENNDNDRKIVTLNAVYRRPELVAVRHWLLSECAGEQTLPAMIEKLVSRDEIFEHVFVVVPRYNLLNFHCSVIPHGLNFSYTPMSQDQFSTLYDDFLRTDINTHVLCKKTWLWREFLKAYLPFMQNVHWEQRDKFEQLQQLKPIVMNTRPELWRKWLHWCKYMIDFEGLPGEIVFCREYNESLFDFT